MDTWNIARIAHAVICSYGQAVHGGTSVPWADMAQEARDVVHERVLSIMRGEELAPYEPRNFLSDQRIREHLFYHAVRAQLPAALSEARGWVSFSVLGDRVIAHCHLEGPDQMMMAAEGMRNFADCLDNAIDDAEAIH